MSLEYDKYLEMHRDCVGFAFSWIYTKIGLGRFPFVDYDKLCYNIKHHDDSKYSVDEYVAYDDYFYSERTEDVKKQFDYAWLHHIHANPHHWQHWILKEDDSLGSKDSMPVKVLEIPEIYIIEMICDWWSFSWAKYLKSHNKKDLYEIFEWYESHTNSIIMDETSEEKVLKILNDIRNSLDSNDHTIMIIT